MKKEYIGSKDWPTDSARKAYRNGYYIEALQILHSWIEHRLQEHLVWCRHRNIKDIPDEVWVVSSEMSFLNVSKALYVIGKITKTTWNTLKQFNSLRNKLIHKYFWEPLDGGIQEIPKTEYDKLFNLGINLAETIERKCEDRCR
jgi:hypothetical protein